MLRGPSPVAEGLVGDNLLGCGPFDKLSKSDIRKLIDKSREDQVSLVDVDEGTLSYNTCNLEEHWHHFDVPEIGGFPADEGSGILRVINFQANEGISTSQREKRKIELLALFVSMT